MTNYVYSYVLAGGATASNFQLCVFACLIYFAFVCFLGRLIGFNILDEVN